MTIQVLLSTMNQKDYSLLSRMNIQSDCIVVNQCDCNKFDEFDFNGHHIQWLSLNERGVGLSRNTALMRASADIVLFADDDVVYSDGYPKVIIDFFAAYPKISVAAFNLPSQNNDRPQYQVTKDTELTIYNCLKYGACRIAARRESLLYHAISFSLLFGGGAQHSAGEDNLFLVQCLRCGLQGAASAKQIGTVEQKGSTWFTGYDEKYYYDRGVLMYLMYGKLSYPFLSILNRRNRPHETTPYHIRKRESMRGIKYAQSKI